MAPFSAAQNKKIPNFYQGKYKRECSPPLTLPPSGYPIKLEGICPKALSLKTIEKESERGVGIRFYHLVTEMSLLNRKNVGT